MKKVTLNCKVFNGEGFDTVQREGVLIDQLLLPGHKFYVTKEPTRHFYHVVEYSTGARLHDNICTTAISAIAEFTGRVRSYGSIKITQTIQNFIETYGRANGDEKEFQSDNGEVRFRSLAETGALPLEIFDLDTIPVGSTYYLETGLSLKRIL